MSVKVDPLILIIETHSSPKQELKLVPYQLKYRANQVNFYEANPQSFCAISSRGLPRPPDPSAREIRKLWQVFRISKEPIHTESTFHDFNLLGTFGSQTMGPQLQRSKLHLTAAKLGERKKNGLTDIPICHCFSGQGKLFPYQLSGPKLGFGKNLLRWVSACVAVYLAGACLFQGARVIMLKQPACGPLQPAIHMQGCGHLCRIGNNPARTFVKCLHHGLR
jgi:hypothetical protein